MSNQLYNRISESFEKQGFMKKLGIQIESIVPGQVTLACSFDESLTQQDGFFHAGVMTSIVDVACGYAALTTMAEEARVLTIEFKTNFIRPGISNKIVAKGKVIKSGKTLVFCEGQVTDEKSGKVLATMTATMMQLR